MGLASTPKEEKDLGQRQILAQSPWQEMDFRCSI